MLMAYESLNILGELGKTQSLAQNIAVMITWQMLCRDLSRLFTPSQLAYCEQFEATQLFVFTALSSDVFNIDNTASTLSDNIGDCNCTSLTSYQIASSLSATAFDMSTYMSNPICRGIATPAEFGYLASVNGNQFSISMDVRTFGDAVGVNSGYLSASDLEYVGNSPVFEFSYQGVSYEASYVIDTVYAGMAPLLCVSSTSEITAATPGE